MTRNQTDLPEQLPARISRLVELAREWQAELERQQSGATMACPRAEEQLELPFTHERRASGIGCRRDNPRSE